MNVIPGSALPFVAPNDRFAALRKRIDTALVEGRTYDEARLLMADELRLFESAIRSEQEWWRYLGSLGVLEQRWPAAAIEGVRCRPVPDSVVVQR